MYVTIMSKITLEANRKSRTIFHVRDPLLRNKLWVPERLFRSFPPQDQEVLGVEHVALAVEEISGSVKLLSRR